MVVISHIGDFFLFASLLYTINNLFGKLLIYSTLFVSSV